MPETPATAIVIGGGWAGLSAAVELARCGVKVSLFEAARQLGGRARCVRFGDDRVDNGQHIMVGAYHSMLALLETLDVDTASAFLRTPLDLDVRGLTRPALRLRARNLPAPLHLALAVAAATGLSPPSRLRLTRFCLRIIRNQITLDHDISAQSLLLSERQDPRLTQALWGPLCLAALNTPIGEASAEIFLKVLGRTFRGDATNADLLIPRSDLGSLLPEPAMDFIERHGGSVILNHRIEGLNFQDDRCVGVRWREGDAAADRIILAVNPVMCRRLLASHPALAQIAAGLATLRHDPITTVYLRYPDAVTLGSNALFGLQDGLGQWFFERRLSGHPTIIAAVISGRGQHLRYSNAQLAIQVEAELRQLHPGWPAAIEHLVIREKRATFAAVTGINGIRPVCRTPVSGLWLAGDFTATELPATLEGAVQSGLDAARQALEPS